MLAVARIPRFPASTSSKKFVPGDSCQFGSIESFNQRHELPGRRTSSRS